MIEAQAALEISNVLHILWAYCQINTEMCEVALDSLVERWLI